MTVVVPYAIQNRICWLETAGSFPYQPPLHTDRVATEPWVCLKGGERSDPPTFAQVASDFDHLEDLVSGNVCEKQRSSRACRDYYQIEYYLFS